MTKTAMKPLVEVKQLRKRFGESVALDGIDIELMSGEMVALIGASGSGKSTLMRHIPGFICSDSGSVTVNGHEIQSKGRLSAGVRKARADIGFVFQQFNLVGRLPVLTNVLTGALSQTSLWRSLLMRFSVSARQEALEALTNVGIEQTAWQRASTLSGGQQQRAALARCLVQGAKLIVADEPIASLDPESSRKVMELLAMMNRNYGCTVMVSLHQVDYALKYCKRTIALAQGRVVYDGPSENLTPALLKTLYGSEADSLLLNNNTSPFSKDLSQNVYSPRLATLGLS